MSGQMVTGRLGTDERNFQGSRKIFKYPLTKKDNVFEFDGKTDVTPVYFAPHQMWVDGQQSEFAVWCELDTENEPFNPGPRKLTFHFIGTGQPIPENFDYINSCQHNGLVWHLYWSWE